VVIHAAVSQHFWARDDRYHSGKDCLSMSELTGFSAKAIEALKGGIPPEVLVMAGKHLVDVDGRRRWPKDAQGLGSRYSCRSYNRSGKSNRIWIEDSIVNTLQQLNPPLETLTLDMNRSFYDPLLEMASQTLTNLQLDIDLEIEGDEGQQGAIRKIDRKVTALRGALLTIRGTLLW